MDGTAYRVGLPRMAVGPRGAGHSMTAGVAAVLARGGELDDAVRTGAAAGASHHLTVRLGEEPASGKARRETRVRSAKEEDRAGVTGRVPCGQQRANPDRVEAGGVGEIHQQAPPAAPAAQRLYERRAQVGRHG